MKIFYCLPLLLAFFFSIGAESSTMAFEVHRKDYTFSTAFELRTNKDFFGSVNKSCFSIRTNYELYDAKGNYEAVGVCRVLTLGAFYAWAREMDCYDSNGNYIGMIDGQAVTGAGAKYSIFNAEGTRVAIIYLDKGNSSFSAVDPNNEKRYLASFTRNFVEDATDHWNVLLNDPDILDPRLCKIFAAFAVDSQNEFKKDN